MAEIQPVVHGELLRTTLFDRISSGLMSANLIWGLFVIAMLLMWWSNGENQFSNSLQPMVLIPTPAVADHAEDTELMLVTETISQDELPEVNRPDTTLALEQVSQAVSNVRATLGQHWGLNGEEPFGFRKNRKSPGPSSGGRVKHWEIKFDELSQEEYYQVLEQFDAKLFVVRKTTNEIVIVTCRNKPKATISNRRELNDQSYFVHETTRMQTWDRQLAAKANVNVDDSFFAINLPPQVLAKLAELERQMAEQNGQSVSAVRRSIFRAHPTESGFDLVIDSQILTRGK